MLSTSTTLTPRRRLAAAVLAAAALAACTGTGRATDEVAAGAGPAANAAIIPAIVAPHERLVDLLDGRLLDSRGIGGGGGCQATGALPHERLMDHLDGRAFGVVSSSPASSGC